MRSSKLHTCILACPTYFATAKIVERILTAVVENWLYSTNAMLGCQHYIHWHWLHSVVNIPSLTLTIPEFALLRIWTRTPLDK
ncbi:hypothetical protein C8J55DRAFT_315957 [Lentinula edodes]|uniref:Uncharacterized protein n=1 Tax=Lentinula lateritia TaxID=40482 RepID=A0A9W9DVS3_9AGAR|nr:hypothetical protein C8J55DRAFT_315957 [Lentinula edodes]